MLSNCLRQRPMAGLANLARASATLTNNGRFLSTTAPRRSDGNTYNKISGTITQPKSQGASQAMLYGTGLTEADMNKAQIGISSVWFEGNPCNMHLLDLSQAVRDSVRKAGFIPYRAERLLPTPSRPS
ncbi:hypothetical protein NQ176_g11130 [Zarea fungicola]|uniref:Uncharacterized protein n=1 Tax=Zarea fungicola TaxID=93591 RepID=A0ACC1MBW0_9HYPO|nr:hypothetical protein NQ176_g11130 [Lecanicillium fungicola]